MTPNEPLSAHAATLVKRLREYTAAVREMADGLRFGKPMHHNGVSVLALTEPEAERSTLVRLRENLSFDSVALRHAARVGIAAALAVAVARYAHLGRGYWVTLTAIVVLQPYAVATLKRGVLRVLGTVAGGVIAALVAATVHNAFGLLVFVFLFAGISAALLPINYGLFSMFLTPAFVLLAELGASDWHLAGVRILNTVVGGTIALACGWLLWPSHERERVPSDVAKAIKASADYLRAAINALTDDKDPEGKRLQIAQPRRAFGLAANNAEASLQRMLGEPHHPQEAEIYMALVSYARRLVAATVAFASSRRYESSFAARTALQRFTNNACATLADLGDSVMARRAPKDLPEFEIDDVADPLLRASLGMIVRQILVLHGTVARLEDSNL